MTGATILERRAAASATLAELERARGAAALDGEAFDAGRLAECRAELEGLDAAEAEATRREREQAAAGRAARQKQARKDLGKTLAAYMEAVAAAEKDARSMVANLKLVQSLSDKMRGECRVIGGNVPNSIDPYEVKAKHSSALATLLRELGGRANYGCIKWNSSPPITSWAGYASKFVATAIQPLIDGE